MIPRNYFPLGMASGTAFCNRQIETAWLVNNVQAGKHSLLIAPRRFGKSSLAEKAITEAALPAVSLNFNACTDETEIEELLRQGVGRLANQALGPLEKIIHSMKKYAQHLTPKLTINMGQTHIELAADKRSMPESNIEEALMLIEKLLADKKSHAIMLLDEFQTVGLIAKGAGIEAAIRNAAQSTKHLTMIFSGSNRHLLKSMFEDESRPLYKLCRKLPLKRIDVVHYRHHLSAAARLAWKKDISDEVFEQIMRLSTQHPYYVNYLCDVLWTDSDHLPEVSDVNKAWEQVIEEEKSDAYAEIANLSMKQKKVLKYIAHHGGEHLLSAGAIKIIGMALSSINTAISSLLEKDIIEKQNSIYIIINPITKAVMSSKN
jgi:uncharacterized protein